MLSTALDSRTSFPAFCDAFQVALVVKKLPANAGDTGEVGSILGSGRSPGGEGMAPDSRILTWRIPWIEEPGGLQSIGMQRDGHN